MSWLITPNYDGLVSDPDANTYLAAVQAVDGQLLEPGVRIAINEFIVGCKADGIWDAIKASCILAGARTLAGALVPLVGTAPTSFNFVTGDYDRETGLVGDGSTKYLDSNRNNNADPQNNHHISLYSSSIQSGVNLGGRNDASGEGAKLLAINAFRSLPSTDTAQNFGSTVAGSSTFVGLSRVSSSSYTARTGSQSSILSNTSTTPDNASLFVFAQSTGGTAGAFTTSRLSFYSIGESLDLALLDARVSTLMSDLAAAIV